VPYSGNVHARGHAQASTAPRYPKEHARRNYERYLALARDARVHGDLIEMENCYQHAEHYFRVMREPDR
jgi:hypothetical protein